MGRSDCTKLELSSSDMVFSGKGVWHQWAIRMGTSLSCATINSLLTWTTGPHWSAFGHDSDHHPILHLQTLASRCGYPSRSYHFTCDIHGMIFRERLFMLPTKHKHQYSGWMTAGVNSTILSSIIVGVVSQVWIREYYPNWFRKYNYILGGAQIPFSFVDEVLFSQLFSGALDGGAQVLIFVLSFAVYGASGTSHPFPTWWGNPDGNVDHCMEL